MHWVDAVLVGFALSGWIVALVLAVKAGLHVCPVDAPSVTAPFSEPTTTAQMAVLLSASGEVESVRKLRTEQRPPAVMYRPHGTKPATAYHFVRHDGMQAVYRAKS